MRVSYSDDFDGDLSQWRIEQMPGGTVEARDGRLVINDAKGCTVWFRKELHAPVEITYTVVATPVDAERGVSDINCFWMAIDPRHPDDLFWDGNERTGKFATYDTLQTYYVGFGGNYNKTTRFRRYTGTGDRPLLPQFDLADRADMIEPGHVYHIRLVAAGGHAKYYRDGQLLFDYPDETPLTRGWFGFRTVWSHLVVDDFKVLKPETEAPSK